MMELWSDKNKYTEESTSNEYNLYEDIGCLKEVITEQAAKLEFAQGELKRKQAHNTEQAAMIEKLREATNIVTTELEAWNLTEGDKGTVVAVKIGKGALRATKAQVLTAHDNAVRVEVIMDKATLAANILRHWERGEIEKFAKHLLGEDAIRAEVEKEYKQDAERWRFTQKENYFYVPTDYGYVVGIQPKGASVNHSILGRGGNLKEAVDDAIRNMDKKDKGKG